MYKVKVQKTIGKKVALSTWGIDRHAGTIQITSWRRASRARSRYDLKVYSAVYAVEVSNTRAVLAV